jgi:MscS family membrane protein
MELSIPALAWVGAAVRAGLVFALFWALWRMIAVIAALTLTRPWARSNPATLSLLTVGANILRGAVLALGVLAMVGAMGYPVGTLLAGLGIGGLALAFGAQKTVENVFGSMALAIDQPLRVGDFVKVEDFVGTVEDIGLRSTRFRTLDRTVVSIPNGKLADQRLESYQLRDRMRLATTVGLTYATSRHQMQAVLAGFERVLRSHSRIWKDDVIVKFKEFGASSLDIEVMAWFQVPTWDEFQQCRQDVLLEFMRVVEEAGSSFAFPTRTVHLVTTETSRGPEVPKGA